MFSELFSELLFIMSYPAPAPLPPIMPTVEDSVEVEDTYLPIVAGGPATNPAAAQPDFSR